MQSLWKDLFEEEKHKIEDFIVKTRSKMISKIVREINGLNLGIVADFGYSETSESGIYVTNTYSVKYIKAYKG